MNTQLYVNVGDYNNIDVSDSLTGITNIYNNDYMLIDLDNNIDIMLNYSISDIRNPFDKKTSFSKTIKIADSQNNRKIFKKLFNINIKQNIWLNKKIEAVLYENTFEIFRGFIKLNEIIIENDEIFYECNLISFIKSIFIDLKDLKLNEIQWNNEGNHKYNFQTISDNNYNSDVKPYIYPFIDYGNFINKIDLTSTYSLNSQMQQMNVLEKSELFKPAFFVKSIIDKIFENQNYTYECELFEQDFFKKLVVPYSKSSLNYSNTTNLIGDADIDGRFILKAKYPFLAFGGSLNIYTDLYNSISNNLELYIGGLGSNVYSSTQSGIENYVLRKDFSKIDINVSFTRISGLADLYVGIYAQGGELLSYKRIVDISATVNTYDETITLTENLEKDNIIVFSIVHGSELDLEIDDFNFKVYDKETTGVVWNSDNILTMNDILPENVKQSDFLRDIFKLFNLYVYQNNFNKNHYIIKNREEYYLEGDSQNWTDILVNNSKIEIQTNITDSSLINFKLKNGEDWHNKLYRDTNLKNFGELFKETSNKYTNNVEKYESIFTSTPYISPANFNDISNNINKNYQTITFIDNTSITRYYPVSKIGWENENGVEGDKLGNILRKSKCNAALRLLHLYTTQLNSETLSTEEMKFNDNEKFTHYTTAISNSFDNYDIDLNYSPDCGDLFNKNNNYPTIYYKFNNLYNYYNTLLEQYKNSDARIIIADFYLTPQTIFKTKLNDKIYINFGNKVSDGWFIINKIIDYDLNNYITKVELIKITQP
jgi:hypothetical protein